jgi:myo-inositol-1(or 4)-monophosphatase
VPLSDAGLVELLHETALAVRAALDGLDDWGLAGPDGAHVGQHHSDVAADEAALAVLERADVRILSEESGLMGAAASEILVVVDPLDGSTNAHRGVPWFATSLCAVDRDGPRAALVVDLPHGRTYTALRGDGASVDGVPIGPTTCTEIPKAVVGVSGWPARSLGWGQFRSLGAAALDLCAVAEGMLDAYVDCSPAAHGPWDYLGGMLVCLEAGAVVGDVEGRALLALDHGDRRRPMAAATPALFDALMLARAL